MLCCDISSTFGSSDNFKISWDSSYNLNSKLVSEIEIGKHLGKYFKLCSYPFNPFLGNVLILYPRKSFQGV